MQRQIFTRRRHFLFSSQNPPDFIREMKKAKMTSSRSIQNAGTGADQNPEKQTLEARIYRVFSDLTRSEQRLADVLLEHQMELPSLTAAELAAKANVSKSTAARLIRALGYRSYPEAKRAIRSEQFWGSPQSGLIHNDDINANSLSQMIEVDFDNIRQTMGAISEQRLTECAQQIANARRIWIIGMRSGEGLAIHAYHYLSLMRSDVQVMDVVGGGLSRHLAEFAPGDLLLTIAFRRRPKFLTRFLDAAQDAGAKTILITDLSAAASARTAEITLRCRTQSPAPFNTFTAAVTLINCLAWQVHTTLGTAAVERYRRIDGFVQEFDDVSMPLASE